MTPPFPFAALPLGLLGLAPTGAAPRVLILGLGASGLALARWCAACGAQLMVLDSRSNPPGLAELQAEIPQAIFIQSPGPESFHPNLLDTLNTLALSLGGEEEAHAALAALEMLKAEVAQAAGKEEEKGKGKKKKGKMPKANLPGGIQAVLKSPGLAPHLTQDLLDAAQARGLWVGNELNLFAQALAHLAILYGYTPAVLAITGTNGKTTTTELTAHLASKAGLSVAMAGNIGPCLLDVLGETLATQAKPDQWPQVWVLELSSFQLWDAAHASGPPLEPTAAVVLNISQDHLDWHDSMADYTQAKAQIFGPSTLRVINADDPAVAALQAAPDKDKAKSEGKAKKPLPCLFFGGQAPLQSGSLGIAEFQGISCLVQARPKPSKPRAAPRDPDSAKPARARKTALELIPILPEASLKIKGQHNTLNALAALGLVSSLPLSVEATTGVLEGLCEYKGAPHRLQKLCEIAKVSYIDDSKGTNVGATLAALHSLGAGSQDAPQKLIPILGGQGKGQDFNPLVEPLCLYSRAVVLVGASANEIAQAIQKPLTAQGIALLWANSLPEAVQTAARFAQAGDTVLLSPACASLDMFVDYAHRARVFAGAVRELAQKYPKTEVQWASV